MRETERGGSEQDRQRPANGADSPGMLGPQLAVGEEGVDDAHVAVEADAGDEDDATQQVAGEEEALQAAGSLPVAPVLGWVDVGSQGGQRQGVEQVADRQLGREDHSWGPRALLPAAEAIQGQAVAGQGHQKLDYQHGPQKVNLEAIEDAICSLREVDWALHVTCEQRVWHINPVPRCGSRCGTLTYCVPGAPCGHVSRVLFHSQEGGCQPQDLCTEGLRDQGRLEAQSPLGVSWGKNQGRTQPGNDHQSHQGLGQGSKSPPHLPLQLSPTCQSLSPQVSPSTWIRSLVHLAVPAPTLIIHLSSQPPKSQVTAIHSQTLSLPTWKKNQCSSLPTMP